MNYCYARVSTIEQHLDRQISSFEPYKPYLLFQDKESGKNFERPQYQKMKKKLKRGDTLIVLSLDRFGRNYDQIKEEWQFLINKGVKIKVIDMPIIDTTSNDLTSKLISDIVINLLSYVAQTEREKTLVRQKQGIIEAKKRGVKFGRPEIKLPQNFIEIATKYKNKEINNLDACEILNMSRGTFFRLLKKHNLEREYDGIRPQVERKKKFIYEVHYLDKIKTLTIYDLLNELDVSKPTLRKYLNGGYTLINRMGIEIIKKEVSQ